MEDLCTCGCPVSSHQYDESLEFVSCPCEDCSGFCPASDHDATEYLPYWDYEDDNSYDTPFEEHLDA